MSTLMILVVYDKGWFVTDQRGLDAHHFNLSKECIIESLREYNPKYDGEVENKYILPKVVGDFYVNDWQPVQNVTLQFEF